MADPKKEEMYVTFKWMLVQTLALIGTVITIGFLIVSSITAKIEVGLASKVSQIQFEERTSALSKANTDICILIRQMAEDKDMLNGRLNLIEQYLAVMAGKPLIKRK